MIAAGVDKIETLIAAWEDGKGGTYRDLAKRIFCVIVGCQQASDQNLVGIEIFD